MARKQQKQNNARSDNNKKKNNQTKKSKQNNKPRDKRIAFTKNFEAAYETSLVRPKMTTLKQGLSMSRCAIKYAMAIAEPFHPAARGACVPVNGTETHKVTSFIRGDAIIGSGGFGFILVSPCLANDLPSLFYTTTGFTGASAVPVSALNTLNTGVASAATSTHPYSASNLSSSSGGGTNQAQGRIVSTGLSLQYTGTLMNESGMVYAFRDPAHNSAQIIPFVNTAATTTYYASRAECQVQALSREKIFVRDFAFSPQEMQFPTDNNGSTGVQTQSIYPYSNNNVNFVTGLAGTFTSYSVGGVATGSPVNVIMFTGIANSTVHFEYVVHSEYTGVAAQAFVTPTESDPVGVDKVVCAAAQVAERLNSHPQGSQPNGWEIMWDALSDVAAKVIPVAVPKLASLAAALLI